MKLTDYVADFLFDRGVDTAFGVTGGAVVHLFDSIANHDAMQAVFCHHEQAASMAAVSYARATDGLGACMVTTGPGVTNAITGLVGAWQDSIPCLFISGQTRKEHTTYGTPLRQLATQELNIIPIVESVTKYAAMVESPSRMRYHLERAVHEATTGRPGPAWLDLPLDFQWTDIRPEEMESFDVPACGDGQLSPRDLVDACRKCGEMLSVAERPLVLLGHGVRLAGAIEPMRSFLEKTGVPVVSSWTASDMIETDDPLYIGRLGVAGQRGANLAAQNSDLIIGLGTHFSMPLTGTNFGVFARDARTVMVDIDRVEFDYPTVSIDLAVCCDVKDFFAAFDEQTYSVSAPGIEAWLALCKGYRAYNTVPQEWWTQKEFVNPYVFMDVLSDLLGGEDIVTVDGGGTNIYMAFQGLRTKPGQRVFASTGICAMGTGIPESIGACFARKGARTICLTGDGSMQFNVQELETIRHHNLNVKIFVFNNDGYLAIRDTQDGFLQGRHVGSDRSGGLSLPDFKQVAAAYGLDTAQIADQCNLQASLRDVLDRPGPVLCEVMISRTQELVPRVGFDENPDGTFSARPLEDMYPFLGRAEFRSSMVTEPLECSLKKAVDSNE